jgi:hypothetical protein
MTTHDVPQGTWKTITFVAALRHDKMVARMVFDGPMTGQMFLAYVEHCLVCRSLSSISFYIRCHFDIVAHRTRPSRRRAYVLPPVALSRPWDCTGDLAQRNALAPW